MLAERYAEWRRHRNPRCPAEARTPGQTALLNAWEDAVECAWAAPWHDPHRLVLHMPRLRNEHHGS